MSITTSTKMILKQLEFFNFFSRKPYVKISGLVIGLIVIVIKELYVHLLHVRPYERYYVDNWT